MTQTFRVVWPITDLDQTLRELQATASGDLPDMLFDAGVQQVGEIRWRLDGDTQLVAEFAVAPWTDPVKDRRRRRAVAA